MNALRSRPLFDIALSLHPPQELGATPLGKRRIVPVAGGSFKGERLSGIVLPDAAADWILVRNDASVQLDVRLTLKTDDGALISMQYRGIRSSSPAVAERLAHGEKSRSCGVLFPHGALFRDRQRKLRLDQQHYLHRCRGTPAIERSLQSIRDSVTGAA